MVKYKNAVVTKDYNRLDEIVFLEYGHLDFLEDILELNIKSIQDNYFLPQGLKLKLPIYRDRNQVESIKRVNRLW